MGGDLLEAFAELESAASRCRKLLGEDAWRLCESELAGLTRRQHELDAQIQTIGLVLVAEADTRGVATAAGATSTQAWLTQTLRMTPQLAKHRVTLARGLKERYPDTGAALAESHISMEQAAAIVSVVDGLPSKATPEDKEGAERFLLERAGELHAGDLRRLGKRIDAVIDPDGTIDREEAAKERRGLTFRDHHDGTQTIAWRETDENIALVKAAMSALSAPVPAGDGTLDPRTPTLRRADAMLEIVAQAMRKGRLPRARGERPHLVITGDITALRGRGFAVTGSGEAISADAVRRLACDADLFGIVMDRWRAPLEMGRRKRTVPPTQWVALCARDVGCASAYFAGRAVPGRRISVSPITWCTGWTAARRTSTTWRCSAAGITTPSITAAGTSIWGRTDIPGSGLQRGSTRSAPRSRTPTGRPSR
jgi:hypothetical protein